MSKPTALASSERTATGAHQRDLVDHERRGVDRQLSRVRALQHERAPGPERAAGEREAVRVSRTVDRDVEPALVDLHRSADAEPLGL